MGKSICIYGNDPWKGARMVVETEKNGLALNLIPQAGFVFKSRGKAYLTLEELKKISEPLKPLIVPYSKINILYDTDTAFGAIKDELKRIGINFEKEGVLPSIDMENHDINTVSISYTDVSKIKRALCKIAPSSVYNTVSYGKSLVKRKGFMKSHLRVIYNLRGTKLYSQRNSSFYSNS